MVLYAQSTTAVISERERDRDKESSLVYQLSTWKEPPKETGDEK